MNDQLPKKTNGVMVDHVDQAPSPNKTAAEIYFSEMGRFPLLKPSEEIALFKRIKSGDKVARLQMIEANLRLVVTIAKDYERHEVSILDLISEGNIGLMKAVDRFRLGKGAKLSTYAAFWIKQAIRRFISNHSRDIRLPIHVGAKISDLYKAQKSLYTELMREATDDELAAKLNVSLKRLTLLNRYAQNQISLDTPVGDDGGNKTIADLIADTATETVSSITNEADNRKTIKRLFASLNAKERLIIKERFGFDGKEIKTLTEIGIRFGVSRERIRQIEAKALKKLRIHHKYIQARNGKLESH